MHLCIDDIVKNTTTIKIEVKTKNFKNHERKEEAKKNQSENKNKF